MASLRDQLVHALDQDPPHGVLGWLRSASGDQALTVARGREQDALRETEALLADPASSPRLRRNAVPVLARLCALTVQLPTAEEIYDATRRGEPFDPYRALNQAMARLLADADVEVQVAAAVELLQVANPGDLPGLRVQLAPLLPRLRERRDSSPAVQNALLALGGAADTLDRLAELAAGAGPLPPDLEIVLAAVDRDPDAAAAPLLARLFPRLDAIAERHDPVREVIGGAIPAWDAATNQVVMLWKLYVRLVPLVEVPAAIPLLRVATPAMAVVLVSELDDLADRAVALAGAAALDATLPAEVRGAAVATLARFAQGQRAGQSDGHSDGQSEGSAAATQVVHAAIDRLQRLRADPLLGGDAARALAGVGAAKS